MLLRHTAYLTCCFLTLPLHAFSGWDKKQSERWVIASIFLPHDWCRTQIPNKQCLDRAFISPKSSGHINIRRVLQGILGILCNLHFPIGEVCWTCSLFPRIQAASHMYRFTRSHQGAARLTQSCFFLYLTSVQLHWSSRGGVAPGSRTHRWYRRETRRERKSAPHLLPLPRVSQACCVLKAETFWSQQRFSYSLFPHDLH